MKEHLITLDPADKGHLARIRRYPNLLAAEADGRLWLRGIFTSKEMPLELRRLPALASYLLDGEGRLFPKGGLTPIGTLPKGLDWQPLTTFLPLEIPSSALPATVTDKAEVQITPSDQPHTSECLLTNWETWQRYADTAPQIRLDRLRFAASADGRALLLGTPLPPIPGREYWMREGRILLPAGFDLDPPIAAHLLPKKLNPAGDSLLLFHENGTYETIPFQHILPATRAAARLTNPQGNG